MEAKTGTCSQKYFERKFIGEIPHFEKFQQFIFLYFHDFRCLPVDDG
jgi:hypothetical protein